MREVFPRRMLLRVLGLEYLAGGLLGIALAVLPGATERGATVLLAMSVTALFLGVVCLAAASSSRLREQTLGPAPHCAMAVAGIVIGIAVHASQDPHSMLLLFYLWTTPYAGIFNRRAGWLHLGWAALCSGVALATLPAVVLPQVPLAWLTLQITALVSSTLVQRIVCRLHAQANEDPLTGLANRSLLLTAVRGALGRRADPDRVALLLVDVDAFQNINDTYGAAAGDSVLRTLADRLRTAVAGHGGQVLVARTAGDEFAVLCEQVDTPVDVDAVAHRLVTACDAPVRLLHGEVTLTVSIGVASGLGADGGALDAEQQLRDAQTALHAAKQGGDGAVRVFDAAMLDASRRRVLVERHLREALARDELRLVYQPVVRLDGSRPIGVEALLRWTNPAVGRVGPAEFVPLAEEVGLIVPLGRWVLDTALRDLAGWRSAGLVDDAFTVAVNLSARQLTSSLPSQVAAALHTHGLPARVLGLELTETAVMFREGGGQVLDQLAALGVTLLLDDFGTGFSSLSHLQRHPFDVLKIDRSFVSDMCARRKERGIVLATLSMATTLGLEVVAEGVETEQQAQELRSAGCDSAQGWHFARPVPADELPDLLTSMGARAAVPAQRGSTAAAHGG